MHIRKRRSLRTLAVAAVALAVGAVPALATNGAHVNRAADPVTPPQHTVTIDVFTAKEQVPGPKAGLYTTTMVPARWGIDLGVTNTVTVYNFTPGAHSIVAPDLNLNVDIKPGTPIKNGAAGATETELLNGVVPSVTTFTVRASTQGVYGWESKAPGDARKWGMAGYIVVN